MENRQDFATPERRHVPLAAVIELLEALTTGRLCRTLLRGINAWVRVDHCSLVRLSAGFGLQVFGSESLPAHAASWAAASIAYIDHHHRVDPLRALLLQPPADAAITLHRLHAREVGDTTYRREYFNGTGIAERLSFVTRDRQDGLVALNFYRRAVSGPFAAADVETLAAIAPLFAVAGLRHVELLLHTTSDPDAWRQRLRSMCAAMTERELDVAAHLLAGKTLREAAAALGVAFSSVVTYRERAYARLGVGNLKELREFFSARVAHAAPRFRLAVPTA